MNSFFISHYLNKITDSRQRATVLSFKGLFYNLSYGILGIAYSLLLSLSRAGVESSHPGLETSILEDIIFIETFVWFPGVFTAAIIVLFLFSFIVLKRSYSLHMAVKTDPQDV